MEKKKAAKKVTAKKKTAKAIPKTEKTVYGEFYLTKNGTEETRTFQITDPYQAVVLETLENIEGYLKTLSSVAGLATLTKVFDSMNSKQETKVDTAKGTPEGGF